MWKLPVIIVFSLIVAIVDPDARAAALPEGFDAARPGTPAPTLSFIDEAGTEHHLRDYRGQVVVLNFWATWCAPCVKEMPALDRLQGAMGDAGLVVLPVSMDFKGFKKISPFFEKNALPNLARLWDHQRQAGKQFGVKGLPITFLIDPAGNLIGSKPGLAEWDSPAMAAVLKGFID